MSHRHRDHPQTPITGPDPVIDLAGTPVVLDVSGGAFEPETRTLVVADLHLEKASSLTERGAGFVPPYDTRATMERLTGVLARLAPHRVIALGDSFHDHKTIARMHRDDLDTLCALVTSVEHWVWIAGNHDPAPPPVVGGEAAGEITLGSITLRHEPKQRPDGGEIAGHLHPSARIRRRGRAVRRRCFVHDARRMIIPAFGALTGGLDVSDRAIAGLFTTIPKVAMLGADRVWPVAARHVESG